MYPQDISHGGVAQFSSIWLSIIITSICLARQYLWAGPNSLQWAVAVDTFTLSLVMTREYNGTVVIMTLLAMKKTE